MNGTIPAHKIPKAIYNEVISRGAELLQDVQQLERFYKNLEKGKLVIIFKKP